MPQLGAIRAIAVIAVVNLHWSVNLHWLGEIWGMAIGGVGGVILFFVLSGFLITSILLNEKYKLREDSKNRLIIIKNFIVRRTLRIFPIYYLYILFFYFAGDPYIRSHWPWFFTYCSNIYFFKIQAFDTNLYNHSWSLAVEEQFYLFWPWLLLFISRKNESKLIISMILLALLSRFVLVILGCSDLNNIVFTSNTFDAFGLGALLAYLKINERSLKKMSGVYKFFKNNYAFLIFVPLILSMYLFFSRSSIAVSLFPIFFPLIYSLFSISLIYKAGIGFEGNARYFFENKIVLYIGKISYGIYLYHKAVPWLYKWISGKTGYELPGNEYVIYCIYLGTVIGIAGLSWFLFEKRINKLKYLFNYSDGKKKLPDLQ